MSAKSPPKPNKKPDSASSQSGFLLPAVQALVIQSIALIFLYASLLIVGNIFNWQMTIGVAALMQGALAMAISHWRRLPLWWLVIQFFFPLAILVGYSLDLSPGVYLGAFVALLLVYWTTFKTRVPLYLSGTSVWEQVVDLLPRDEPVKFIDIGSGLGGLALDVANRCPQVVVTGVELAPIPWLISWLRARLGGSHVQFIRGDYNNFDFSQFDVVFAYLSPAAMNSLWKKASAEMRSDTLLLSYEFSISDVKPDIVIQVSTGGSKLYGWRVRDISHK